MNRFLNSLLLLIAFNPLFAQTEEITIGDEYSTQKNEYAFSGNVYDGESGESIIGAVVNVIPGNLNSVTGLDGDFKFELRKGIYNLKISFLGYEEYAIKINVIGDGKKDFYLTNESVSLEEITVTEKRSDQNVNNVIAGVEQISIEKLQQKSKFLGEVDVLRSLQSVTGVTSAGEGASGFNVRGGNTDENFILMDNNLIFNPVHALGFFSTFHPDMVQSVTLYKGGVPAKYGGRLSSVLDVNLREGSKEKFSARGGIGMVASRVVVEGPIIKNKASFIIGARASYIDWVLKSTSNLDLRKSQAFFYDLNAKFDADLSKTTRIGLTAFTTDDDFQFTDIVKFKYSTTSGSAFIKQLVGDKINITARLNKGRYTSNLFDVEGNNQSQFTNVIDYLRGSLNTFYQVKENIQLEFGLGQSIYDILPGKIQPFGDSFVIPETLPKEKGVESDAFIQSQISVGEKIEIMVGARYVKFDNIGPRNVILYEEGEPKSEFSVSDSISFNDGDKIASYSGLEPRFSLRYSFNESSSIKLGYNRSFQFLSQISNTASATPIDVWQLSNYHLEPQRSDNFSAGYYRNFKNNTIQTYVDFFYRDIDQLIDYKDFARLLLNQNIETELITGVGKAYGAELYFNKAYGKNRFEVNYTYSRTLRKIEDTDLQVGVNRGNWYPSNYDKPHSLNINYVVKPSQKQSFSVNFTYSTGRPTTAPVSSYSSANVLTIPVYSDRNLYRIPDYHRLDIAYTIGPWGKPKKWQHNLTLSVYNLYFRKNAFSVFFRQNPFSSVEAYRVAVLGSMFPAITYDFKF